MDILQTMNVSAGGMFAQSQRMKAAAENIANADSIQATNGTGAYRAKQVTFQSVLNRETGMTEVKAKTNDDMNTPMRTVYNPSSDMADPKGFVSMPNVDTAIESINMKEAQRSYEANLSAITTAREMATRTLDMMR